MTYTDLHAFASPELLAQALTHPSYANEHPGTPTYQRLEFLGDAVLQLLVSEILLERHPDWDEGALSKARSQIVDRRQCAALATGLGLAADLRTERGLAGGFVAGSKPLADVFEAYVAAVYLDAGLARAADVLRPLLAPLAAGLSPGELRDPKSALQEYCQARHLALPVYEQAGSEGPAHALVFSVYVHAAGRSFGPATASKKRIAEGEAARIALAALTAADDTAPEAT